MSRRVFVLASLLVFTACGGGGGGGLGSYGLQSSDVPSGFTSCSGWGDVTTSSDKDVQGEWNYQKGQGATGGYITVYAASGGDCQSIISSGPGSRSGGSKKLIASVVLQFKDSASAEKGSQGAFGVGVSGLQHLGGASGSSVGLPSNSAYLYTPQAGAAAWSKDAYSVGIVAQNVKESDLKKAISAVAGRIP